MAKRNAPLWTRKCTGLGWIKSLIFFIVSRPCTLSIRPCRCDLPSRSLDIQTATIRSCWPLHFVRIVLRSRFGTVSWRGGAIMRKEWSSVLSGSTESYQPEKIDKISSLIPKYVNGFMGRWVVAFSYLIFFINSTQVSDERKKSKRDIPVLKTRLKRSLVCV